MKKSLQNNLLKALLIALLWSNPGINLFSQNSTPGIVGGAFTVNSNGDKVVFSQGNLQYIGSAETPYWKFAEHQSEYLGTTTNQGSSNQNVDRDLFGWGTSGYNHGATAYQPWSTITTNSQYYAYGSSSYHLYNQTGKADWGYNAIANGGNQENSGWRTLTNSEWTYMFNTRSTSSGIRYAKAKVNDINGVILLPDGWLTSFFSLSNTNNSGASYSSNTISLSQWDVLEQYGAVFFSAAGDRTGTTANIGNIGSLGVYWASTNSNSSSAYHLRFDNGFLDANSSNYRYYGFSVRLVRPAQDASYSINATSSPTESGTVSGVGTYQGGTECTLTATPSTGHAFLNWTEAGVVVSTNATYSFIVLGNRNLEAHFIPIITEGFTNHGFTVSASGDNVVFSQGNLQYIGSAETPYWKFADNQWDYFGSNTNQGSTSENVDRDLFGWGTSGYNHGATAYQPWSTSTTNSQYYAYGSSSYNLFDQTGQADWGYNAIVNGGNQENIGWRTLTNAEWTYVFNTRNTSSGIRYAKAKVNNINGMILLPDDWQSSYYTLNNTNSSGANYTTNTITATQWASLEQYGAVFLPAAGHRSGNAVENVGSYGNYYSASFYNSNSSNSIYFYSSGVGTGHYDSRFYGRSVRLVRPSKTISFSINATSSPAEGGTVSGASACLWGNECVLTATPSTGYTFVNWMENGIVVSTNPTYAFVVSAERHIVANFTTEGNIVFADDNVKALCVANWDTNNDGELSFGEAAAVTSLGNVFKNNTTIQSFAELQHFIVLGTIGSQAFYGCTELTQVTIPTGVTSIGAKAFWNCPKLQTVRFNAVNCTSMQTYENSTYYSVFSSDGSGSAPDLKSVLIGNNVQRIPDYAFKGSVALYPGLSIRSSVKEIGAHAFENCSAITTLMFEKDATLTTIGDYAFNGCSSLNKALNIPNSVKSIGQYAFYGCWQIPSLTIGTSTKTIGDYAFWYCKSMTTVNFNATNCSAMVTDSQYSVFNDTTLTSGSTPIVTLTIGDNVTRIPDYAFRNSTHLTSAITIPDATTYIGQYAFHGVKSQELTIGEGLTTVGGCAFWNCPNLATVHFNATNCTTMNTSSSYSVFNSGTSNSGATPIVTLSIGDNVTRIPDYAFRNSTNLTSVITIPDATTYIGQYAFYGVKSQELTIGEDMMTIGGNAFWNCPNLSTVYFNAVNCTTMNTSSSYSVFNTGTSNGGATPIVTLTIGENVTNIPDYAFRSSPNLIEVLLLPSELTNIGDYAFDGCSGFTGDLVFPNTVSTIGQYAFRNCSGFNGTLTLPVNDAFNTINQYTFDGCNGLIGTLTIPTNVTSIGSYAFQGCSSFTGELMLHDAITSIGSYAFYGCTNIPELTIGKGVTSIGGYAFWNCPNMATVHFNATNCTSMVTNWSYSVFNSGTSNGGSSPIVTLTIGSNVTNIPNYAFRYSNRMTCDLDIPNSVTSIGQYAFANCSGKDVSIGNGVTTIGNYAFNNSSGIHGTLLLGNAIATIGEYAFSGCTGFTGDLVIPNAVTNLGQYAFRGCSGFSGTLIIGSGVQTINQYTFADCPGFAGALIVGTQVNNIGNYAFQNCSGFALLITENPNPVTAQSTSFTNMTYSIPVYVPDGLVNNYRNATGWNVFTNYIEQFTFWQELDNDNWSDEINWLSNALPTENDVVCIAYNCNLDIDVNVLHVYVLNINDELTVKSGKTLTTTYGMGIIQPSQFILEEGSQLVNNLPGLNGTVQRRVNSYGVNDGWYSIAAPVFGGMPVNGITTGTYDLYAYDEPTHYWMNEKINNDLTTLTPGQGYLYANQNTQTISLAGQLIASNAEISIPVSYTDHELPGLNLVGNPYTNNISIGNVTLNGTPLTAYYKAIGGSNFVPYTDADDEPIQPGEGFLVVVDEEGTLTFSPTVARDVRDGYVRLMLSREGQVCDRAYLSMNHGNTLGKLQSAFGQGQLYFLQDGERRAMADQRKEASLRFEPSTTATFIIEASLLNTEVDYLHLIDHLTGSDIDLLETPSYTFEADLEDASDRFSLAFAPHATQEGRSGDNELDGRFMMPYHNVNDDQNAFYNVFVIVASADAAANGSVTGSGNYPRGATCTLTASPNTGYTFVNWTKNDVVVSETPTYSFVVTDGGTYVAHFYHGYKVTASADADVAGTVTGAGFYENGASCTLTAAPESGYKFYCWTQGEGLVVSTTASYNFTVTEDVAYVAHFLESSDNTTIESGTVTVTATANDAEGGTVDGGGAYLINSTCTLTAVANIGYMFSNWTKDDEVVSTSATYSFTALEDAELVANFVEKDGNTVQTTALTEGWNWYSTYVEQDGIEGLAQLETSLGSNGVIIKSRSNGFVTNFGPFWSGSLVGIDNMSTYLVQTTPACEMTITGNAATATAYPITLTPGWSWIGYPSGSSMSVSTALAGITPLEGDMLKTRESFSTYSPGVGWVGSLQTITPGMGLMYESHSTGELTLIYPEPSKSDLLLENLTAQHNYWKPAMQAYPYNMTVVAVVELDHAAAQSTQYELAVFANDECRGSAKLQYVAAMDRYLAFLTVFGEKTADLRFALYDAETGMEYSDANQELAFVADDHVGSLRDPYTVQFKGMTALQETDNLIQVYPNPVGQGQMFNIGQSAEELGEVQIEFVNALGAVVSTEKAMQLPVSVKAPDAAGVYILRISVNGKGVRYGKLIVK